MSEPAGRATAARRTVTVAFVLSWPLPKRCPTRPCPGSVIAAMVQWGQAFLLFQPSETTSLECNAYAMFDSMNAAQLRFYLPGSCCRAKRNTNARRPRPFLRKPNNHAIIFGIFSDCPINGGRAILRFFLLRSQEHAVSYADWSMPSLRARTTTRASNLG